MVSESDSSLYIPPKKTFADEPSKAKRCVSKLNLCSRFFHAMKERDFIFYFSRMLFVACKKQAPHCCEALAAYMIMYLFFLWAVGVAAFVVVAVLVSIPASLHVYAVENQ